MNTKWKSAISQAHTPPYKFKKQRTKCRCKTITINGNHMTSTLGLAIRGKQWNLWCARFKFLWTPKIITFPSFCTTQLFSINYRLRTFFAVPLMTPTFKILHVKHSIGLSSIFDGLTIWKFLMKQNAITLLKFGEPQFYKITFLLWVEFYCENSILTDSSLISMCWMA